MKTTHFFLGANSAEGFYSLYDRLLTVPLRELLILKGGAGCGKSTFMRRAAAELERRGQDAIYIHCSGDPTSLDGVIFPGIRAAIVDGTAPHVLEPRYMAARERYVDFSPCYDLTRAEAQRERLIACTEDYRAQYREADHVLRALGEVDDLRRSAVSSPAAREKLLRRAAGIAARELRGGGEGGGRSVCAFLGGVTCAGVLCRFDTVDALCPRVYELCDSYGLAEPMLRFLQSAAEAAGEDVIECRDPSRPAHLQHLLLPQRGLAFITTGRERPYTGKPYRRLRVDAAAEEGLARSEKARLRFLWRVRRALAEEAVETLGRAKEKHDALEEMYRPLIDFSGVEELCARETARLTARCD